MLHCPKVGCLAKAILSIHDQCKRFRHHHHSDWPPTIEKKGVRMFVLNWFTRGQWRRRTMWPALPRLYDVLQLRAWTSIKVILSKPDQFNHLCWLPNDIRITIFSLDHLWDNRDRVPQRLHWPIATLSVVDQLATSKWWKNMVEPSLH